MKISYKQASKCAVAMATLAMTATAAHARPMTEVDLAGFNRLGEVTVSPDERYIAYNVTKYDLAKETSDTVIFLMDRRNSKAKPRPIANDPDHSEYSPQFSADGKSLYYISGKSGKDQVWKVDLAERANATQVTTSVVDIAGFKLSPDGKQIALWADLPANCTLIACAVDNMARLVPEGTGREYDRIFVRHWSSWEVPGEYSTVFTAALDDNGVMTGDAKNLSGQLTGDTPSKPFGGGEEIAWAADSSAVAFALRKSDAMEPRSTNLDIYVAPSHLDSEQPTANLTAANQAMDTLPAPSPDGKYLAWAAMERPGYEADKLSVKLLDIAKQKVEVLTSDWDYSVGSISWAKDGKSVIVTANDTLNKPAFSIDIKSKQATRLTGEGSVGQTIPLADGSLIYTHNDLNNPYDIMWRTPKGEHIRLTNLNPDLRDGKIDPVKVNKFSFKGANGDTVHGMVVKPQSSDEKLPMAFIVHGGPQGSFGDSWSYRWNPKVMAAQGYAVVTIDFHGSTGYGQAFTDSINQDWGGKPLEDLKLGMAALPQIDAQVDTENGCALGASYGGYMMNWISGNWPDQFKCIINHAGVFDLRSMAFSTEELWFDEWADGGPWYSRPNAEKWNPVNHVTKWKTPTLVIHGEKDFRIPYSQSLGAFTALQRQDIPSKLLIFPDENHWVLKPKNSIQWHRNVFQWMKKWTQEQK